MSERACPQFTLATDPTDSQGRLLVVDDDPFMLELVRLQAQKLGYQVATADNAAAALKLLATDPAESPLPFDLLLTDILMPEMDGLSLLEQARQHRPELEVIVFSGQDEIKTAVAAMRRGARDYLQKPFSRQELEIALRKGMEHVRLQRQLRRQQEELHRSNRELDQYHRQLEQLVAERTAELAAANRQLKEDIKARQQAEEEARQRRRQLIETDKMASLGILVAGVAHEINNPNNFIGMNVPTLERIWDDLLPLLRQFGQRGEHIQAAGLSLPELEQHIPELLTGINSGSRRINQIVKNLNDYARQSGAEMNQEFALAQVAQAALTLLASPLRKATRHLRVELATELPLVKGNFQRVEQVVVNLLQNAIQALDSPEQGITIRTIGDPIEESWIGLEVADQGRGISNDDLPRLQDPFFTTKRDSGGTGLGLSISAGIMEEHGGRLEFSSKPAQGTTVRAIFPCQAG
ncbi:MAG: response regulator [Desulfurivibrio sp.]|nr:response regulator [Desulfurivibrio sp.]